MFRNKMIIGALSTGKADVREKNYDSRHTPTTLIRIYFSKEIREAPI